MKGEMFKPTKANIILTIILVIIFVPSLSIDNGVRCIRAPCDADMTASILIYLLALIGGGSFIYEVFYLNLIIGIIASYIVSCIIIHVYEKTKKKKKIRKKKKK